MKHSPRCGDKRESIQVKSGKRVAVDASLTFTNNFWGISKWEGFKNSKGKITSHITGVFYKIMNYISLNIEMIFDL